MTKIPRRSKYGYGFYPTKQTGPASVFRHGGNQGKRRPVPSMPAFSEPCRSASGECAQDGSCLRCGADQGIACRLPPGSVR